MAGPKEEWLIWDRRFQFGYSCLNQRLKTNEEATQQIAQLDQNAKHLAATSKQLEETNEGLRDRVQKLEQALCRVTQLDEQIQELTASSRSLKEENNVLNDRILQLEQEGTHRDQENRLIQEQLKEKLKAQEEDFKSVVIAVRGMHEIDSAERAQRGEDIQRLRSQLEVLIATRRTPGAHTRNGESTRKLTRRRSVSNVGHSVGKTLSGHYRRRRRKDASQSACQAAAAAAAAKCHSPRCRGPRHAHKGPTPLHSV